MNFFLGIIGTQKTFTCMFAIELVHMDCNCLVHLKKRCCLSVIRCKHISCITKIKNMEFWRIIVESTRATSAEKNKYKSLCDGPDSAMLQSSMTFPPGIAIQWCFRADCSKMLEYVRNRFCSEAAKFWWGIQEGPQLHLHRTI